MKEQAIEWFAESREKGRLSGFKISFEDEGATLEDLIELRLLSASSALPLFVKVGGCEAKTDINNCKDYLVDGIVGPMIESNFSLEKFIRSSQEVGFSGKKFINIETKTSIQNLNKIINSPSSTSLDGLTIGRSDLAASYGLTKKSVDSPKMYKVIEQALIAIKGKGFATTMGGNITSHSAKNVKSLYEKGLLDKIETRNIIIKLTPDTVNDLTGSINEALFFETFILELRKSRTGKLNTKNIKRLEELKRRLEV